MLAVSDGNAAIAFYKAAFGAALLWHLDGEHVVAGLSINGAKFFLASESPPHGMHSPSSAGFTTVKIELFVDDPIAVQRQAIAAGAVERNPVSEHEHETAGPQSIKRMSKARLSIRSVTCGSWERSWSSCSLETIRAEPRFKAILKRINFPQMEEEVRLVRVCLCGNANDDLAHNRLPASYHVNLVARQSATPLIASRTNMAARRPTIAAQ
jgi:uncharacterized glyoxalase superfamily protein PhnB